MASAPAASAPAITDAELSAKLTDAISHLERYGYCLVPGLMPPSEADQLRERILELHANPANRQYIVGQKPYETLFGLLNLEPRVWQWASHPFPVALARRLLGPRVRVAEVVSKPTWPDPSMVFNLHVDSAHMFNRIPDVPWIVNSIWMLNDFTAENGATGVVPMSHLSRSHPTPDLVEGHRCLIPVEGRRGSLMMWHAGLFHTARPNRSPEIRVGMNISYYPPWFNIYGEGGHQPIWPEVFAKMPPHLQELLPQRKGHSRAEVYEGG